MTVKNEVSVPGECGVLMDSAAVQNHVHVCTRPEKHRDDPADPDHYCGYCHRHFFERPDLKVAIKHRGF